MGFHVRYGIGDKVYFNGELRQITRIVMSGYVLDNGDFVYEEQLVDASDDLEDDRGQNRGR